MPSLINKIAFNKGKEVDIIFDDNNIEISHSVIEYIYDPIIHIFRNAVDHGIETAAERKAKGKNHKGKIECKTYLENNTLIIKIKDDGKGVDFDKIAQKGKCSVMELNQSGKLLSIISSPGFTTKENADEHSGRGFGMNLVRKKLAEIGALLEIDSKENMGTLITIKISNS
jgi:two-component system chemotaxis sensor kinase CheA